MIKNINNKLLELLISLYFRIKAYQSGYKIKSIDIKVYNKKESE